MPGERKVGQDHGYYDWSPLTKRKPLKWPNNARVALVTIVNLEHWDWQLPPDVPGAPTGPFRPNLAEYSQHEYGNRVGVFRILRILDKYGITPTIAMDKTVADSYPFLVAECKKRKLEVMAHGVTARRPLYAEMTADAERAYIRESIAAVTKAMGKAPAGWLGPDFTETMNTPNLLGAEGIRYVCDWSNDEQPYKMKVPQGELYSLGVDYDTDDVYIHWTGRRLIDEYRQIMVDNFDGLYRDGAKSGRLMVVNIHPWVMGWPWRSKYLDRAMAHIAKHPNVWKASASDVVDWYKANANI
jgi:peptidoglycan/xylan/chitin deacetylase (PgdA/CDA1 family)